MAFLAHHGRGGSNARRVGAPSVPASAALERHRSTSLDLPAAAGAHPGINNSNDVLGGGDDIGSAHKPAGRGRSALRNASVDPAYRSRGAKAEVPTGLPALTLSQGSTGSDESSSQAPAAHRLRVEQSVTSNAISHHRQRGSLIGSAMRHQGDVTTPRLRDDGEAEDDEDVDSAYFPRRHRRGTPAEPRRNEPTTPTVDAENVDPRRDNSACLSSTSRPKARAVAVVATPRGLPSGAMYDTSSRRLNFDDALAMIDTAHVGAFDDCPPALEDSASPRVDVSAFGAHDGEGDAFVDHDAAGVEQRSAVQHPLTYFTPTPPRGAKRKGAATSSGAGTPVLNPRTRAFHKSSPSPAERRRLRLASYGPARATLATALAVRGMPVSALRAMAPSAPAHDAIGALYASVADRILKAHPYFAIEPLPPTAYHAYPCFAASDFRDPPVPLARAVAALVATHTTAEPVAWLTALWLFDRLADAAEARAAAYRRAALEDAPTTTDHAEPPAAATRVVVRPAYAVVPRGGASSHREQPPKTHKHHALKASAERGVPAMAIAYDARFAASFAISLYSMSECAVGDYSCYPRFYTEHGALKRYAAPRSARYMGQGCPWDLAAISQRQWLAAEALDWRLTPSGDDLAALIAKYMTIDEAAAAARYAGVSE